MLRPLPFLLLFASAAAPAADPSDGLFDLEDLRVKITESLPFVELGVGKDRILLMRHQDPDHTVESPYDQTARGCPPYCVQPMHLAPGVETIGELELIEHLRRAASGEPVLVIDSRTPVWTARGMIPGAVEIPYDRLDPATADPAAVVELLQLEFGAARVDGLWNFETAKTLVFYCNGAWCGQSPTNIRALLNYGYPAHKLKWYRGGMQAWEQLGLTTVKPNARDPDSHAGHQ
ncbi:MAG: rhodanese-like domain-containing protein [Chromatiaceae bacterium]